MRFVVNVEVNIVVVNVVDDDDDDYGDDDVICVAVFAIIVAGIVGLTNVVVVNDVINGVIVLVIVVMLLLTMFWSKMSLLLLLIERFVCVVKLEITVNPTTRTALVPKKFSNVKKTFSTCAVFCFQVFFTDDIPRSLLSDKSCLFLCSNTSCALSR